jgi:transketolase
MRDTISNFLKEKAKINPNVYVFSGDHGYALFDELRRVSASQFINVGVSEQAMIGYAAGMAKEGMKPFVYGLSAFLPLRVIEFIKMDICYESLPVILLGDGAGLVYATLGPSHQCAEDIACIRTLPHITVLSPADAYEMQACLDYAYDLKSPSYIRIGKADKTIIHAKPLDSLKNELLPLIETSSEICLVATGSMVDVAKRLSEKFGFSLFSAPFIHPLNKEFVLSQIERFKTVVSLEEHSIHGGLGSILAELLCESRSQKKVRLRRIGIQGRFTEKCGSYEYAIREHKLDIESIEQALRFNLIID